MAGWRLRRLRRLRAAPAPAPASGSDSGSDPADSFCGAISHALALGRPFGLLPVQGVAAGAAARLRFRWRSWPVLQTALVLAGGLLICACSALELRRQGFSYINTASLAFYGQGVAALLLFLQLARRWPALARRWASADAELTRRYGPPVGLRRRLRLLSAGLLSVALAEHVLANLSGLLRAGRCSAAGGGGAAGWLRSYCRGSLAQVFARLPYWPPLGLLLLFVNFAETVAWNYTDLFLMLVSAGLAARFRQLNAHLDSVRGEALSPAEWRSLREDFNRLSQLTKAVDARLSPIALFSFANNMYFICLQLFRSVSLNHDWGIVYFYVSFGYMLARTAAVLFHAAAVHSEGRRPRDALFCVPARSWGVEPRRFLTQALHDDIALTGLRFFAITRTLILTVAGTVTTYEVVLFQLEGLGSQQCGPLASSGGGCSANLTEPEPGCP